MDTDNLSFSPVTSATCADFEVLFSSPGAPKHCWCMVWRRSAAEAKENDGESRKRQMLERIGTDTPVGLIGHLQGTPVAWVSVAPRETYRNLGGLPVEPGEVIWSIVCFFVQRRLRGRGLARLLITGAVNYAKEKGATIVEAYPVDPDAPSYRFMGFVSVFAEAGFVDVGRAGRRRHVMRLTL